MATINISLETDQPVNLISLAYAKALLVPTNSKMKKLEKLGFKVSFLF